MKTRLWQLRPSRFETIISRNTRLFSIWITKPGKTLSKPSISKRALFLIVSQTRLPKSALLVGMDRSSLSVSGKLSHPRSASNVYSHGSERLYLYQGKSILPPAHELSLWLCFSALCCRSRPGLVSSILDWQILDAENTLMPRLKTVNDQFQVAKNSKS